MKELQIVKERRAKRKRGEDTDESSKVEDTPWSQAGVVLLQTFYERSEALRTSIMRLKSFCKPGRIGP